MSPSLRLALTGWACLLMSPAAAAQLSVEEGEALREEVRILRARLAAIEARLGEGALISDKPAEPVTRFTWKGSPQAQSEDRAFKVKGRIQADVGHVSTPHGLSDRGLGVSNEFRRIRLGGEGKLGSGFGYKLELELSDNGVDLVDTFVTYDKGPWQIAVGNQNQFQSLDELIGDTGGSVMERAAFTDAFGFERRLGVAVQYRGKSLLLQAGLFSDDIGALSNDRDGPDGGDENNSVGVDGRVVLAPRIGSTQFHLGVSAHWRRLGRLADVPTRYRQRPYLHSSNSRVLATQGIRVDREFHHGGEFAAVRGRWHVAAEGHWLKALGPGPDPRFFGGYAEIGYYLTPGDSRPYRNGIFGTAAPSRPFGQSGAGAVQINLRYDYLDLDDGAIRGGKQNGWLAGIVWTPIEYLRFNLNHGYLRYDGAAISAGGDRDYGLHVTGARIELDF